LVTKQRHQPLIKLDNQNVMSRKIKCQLCGHDIPEEYLSDHHKTETKETIQYTVDLIKRSNPDWIETDGTCKKCWAYYRSLEL